MKKRQAERFYYEIGTLLATGFPLYQALDLMGARLAKEADKVKSTLSRGQTLSESIFALGGVEAQDVQILRLAEETGRLPSAFLELAEMHRTNRELSQKLLSFAVYPILMLVLVFGYLIFALFFMVPMMAELLQSLDVREGLLFALDGLRRFLLVQWAPCTVAFILTLSLLAWLFRRYHWGLWLVLGRRCRLYREVAAVERLTRLLKGGRNILDVLDLAGEMEGIDRARIRAELLSGEPLSKGLSVGGFSKELTALTRLHEEGGDLTGGFELYLKTSRAAIAHTLEQRIRLLEPVSLVLVGAVVGLTVVSIMGPLMDAFGRIQ